MNGAPIFFGLLILLFVIWLGSGGQNRPISLEGPYLNRIVTTGTSATAYGESREAGAPGVIGDLVGDTGTPVITEAEASPHRGLVTLGRSPQGAKQTDARREYISIRVSSQEKDAINITGWTVVSTVSKKAGRIPTGTEVARTGTIGQASNITVSGGDEVIITTGRSPVGASFRENLCTGYLEQFQDFSPQLQNSCPAPSSEFTKYATNPDDEECRNFLRSVQYCETDTNPENVSATCESFVNQYLTYNGCVRAHEKDADFKERTWRVFLGTDEELWGNQRDTIQLLDGNGKVVDVLSY